MEKKLKLSLFVDDMFPHIEKPKDGIINKFAEIEGYKINTQKSVAFLFTNNKRSERKIQETLPFTNTSKRIKY